VLSAVYEADFWGFSCGFRPGRDPHMALDALQKAIMSQRVKRGLFQARPIAAE
jgi:RNA-directed DNA polymerase